MILSLGGTTGTLLGGMLGWLTGTGWLTGGVAGSVTGGGRLGTMLASLPAAVPVDPDGDQAQQWIVEELGKAEYQAAEPSWFDRLSEAFWNWLNSLDLSGGGAAQGPLLVILVVVIAAALIAAFLIFGMPRLRHRSVAAGALFGEDEVRSSDQLRGAAESAAKDGNWAAAIEELFRSVAKRLAERVLVSTSPGTTAHGFARQAGAVLPEFSERLLASGALFDRVRYLGEPGSGADYEQLSELERELRLAKPAAVPLPLIEVSR